MNVPHMNHTQAFFNVKTESKVDILILSVYFDTETFYFRIALYPDEDQFLYLQNGSLLYIDERILLSQDQYCVETLEEIEAAVPFICLRPRGTPEVIYYIYASGKSFTRCGQYKQYY